MSRPLKQVRLVGLLYHACGPECAKSRSTPGPSKVNSKAYIENWGRIFGGKATEGKA